MLQLLSDQGRLTDALVHVATGSTPAAMTDAVKRRGDDLPESEGFEVVSSLTSSVEPEKLPIKKEPVASTEVKLPTGIPDLQTWGRTVCTLPKYEERHMSYSELVEEAQTSVETHRYLYWVQGNTQKSPKVKDFAEYMKASGVKLEWKRAPPAHKCLPGTSEERQFK